MPISTLTFAAIDNFTLADGMAVVLWLAKLSFAVLGGADFGAGVWDLLAGGETKEEQRGALIRAIGPIWEANEIWLIFLITGAWTGFPLVFGSIMATMFVPLTLGLLGIVMRGAGFAIYSHFRREVEVNLVWGRVFSIAGTVTPFFFGAVAAAVASGQIHVSPSGQVSSDLIASWTTPFALACGCFAVALCACLAATYMTVETRNQGELRITRLFRRRALISGSIAALIGVVAALIARSSAPYLFNGLTTRALPLALAGVLRHRALAERRRRRADSGRVGGGAVAVRDRAVCQDHRRLGAIWRAGGDADRHRGEHGAGPAGVLVSDVSLQGRG